MSFDPKLGLGMSQAAASGSSGAKASEAAVPSSEGTMKPKEAAAEALTMESAESKKGSTGTRSWRRARGLAEWMSESHVMQRAAASALHVTAAGACSQTSHTHTRSWRDASLLAQ